MASGFPSIEAKSVSKTKEASMMEDDPRFDPVIRRHESIGGVWGWLAAVVSSLLLIGFIIAASLRITTLPAAIPHKPPRPPHRDTAEHRGLRLVITEADHPGAIEERHAIRRSWSGRSEWMCLWVDSAYCATCTMVWG